jgi:hypothetical protein
MDYEWSMNRGLMQVTTHVTHTMIRRIPRLQPDAVWRIAGPSRRDKTPGIQRFQCRGWRQTFTRAHAEPLYVALDPGYLLASIATTLNQVE